jgi:hypothetical protein
MVSQGDKFCGESASLANNGTFNIQPPAGNEATVHNIRYSGAVQLFYITPNTSIQYDYDTGAGGRLSLVEDVNSTYYIQVLNNSGSSINVSFSGVYTK